MFKLLYKKVKNNEGTSYIDVVILLLTSILVIALAINLYPTFIVKDQLNTLAKQALREAQLEGKIEVSYNHIAEAVGIDPDTVEWKGNTFQSNKVQFNDDMEVLFTKTVDIGFFEFGSFPINLKGKARGKSEVYWK